MNVGGVRIKSIIKGAEFGRQTFSPRSKWYQQYANLWGCYTNLCQWVGHYGDDDVALGNFNNNVAALAL